MVAKTVALPNIRKIFIPDQDCIFLDVDLGQADARVVAWDSGAEKLKAIFNDPSKDLHDENAKAIFGRVDKYTRPLAKRGVHAVNYGITAKALSVSLGISLQQALHFIDAWFTAHPEIPAWHNRVQNLLETTRTVRNAFGFRKVYYDRVEHLLPEALGWIPQSTVAITINKAMLNIENNLPDIVLKAQVHDSLLLQLPRKLFPSALPEIKSQFMVQIPYSDPFIIPPTVKASAISWGDVQKIDWCGTFESRDLKIAAGF